MALASVAPSVGITAAISNGQLEAKEAFTSGLSERLSESNCLLRSESYRNRRRIAFLSQVLLPKSQCANGNKNPNFTPGVLHAINSYRRPGCMRETA
jgi:hypothetical protein